MDRVPLGFGFQTRGVVPEGFQLPEGVDDVEIDYGAVGPSYFEALEIPILRGRAFSDEDVPESESVAIVNEAFVQQYWPGESGVGKTVEDRATLRIVGVAANTKSRTLGEDPRPQIFINHAQGYIPSLFIFVRGTIPEAQILGQLQSIIRTARSDLVVMDGLTMTEHMKLPLFAPRLAAILLTVFGSLALVLSGIGLYGVVSYTVSQRTREVGIRMSLGADAMQVVRMVVGSGLKLVAVGGFFGLILSGAVTWVLSSFLYGIGTLDVATFIMIPALLTAVAGIAAFVPARRASRLNPVDALRRE
jgi:predicted permease